MPDFSTWTDEDLLTLCAWREGRGDIAKFGIVTILGIMHVVTNRIGALGFGKTLRDVILGKNQFSSFSPADPEWGLLPEPGDPIYQMCRDAAEEILTGTDPDCTNGAKWYANLSHISAGCWFDRNILQNPAEHPMTVVLGHHSFYL